MYVFFGDLNMKKLSKSTKIINANIISIVLIFLVYSYIFSEFGKLDSFTYCEVVDFGKCIKRRGTKIIVRYTVGEYCFEGSECRKNLSNIDIGAKFILAYQDGRPGNFGVVFSESYLSENQLDSISSNYDPQTFLSRYTFSPNSSGEVYPPGEGCPK